MIGAHSGLQNLLFPELNTTCVNTAIDTTTTSPQSQQRFLNNTHPTAVTINQCPPARRI